MEKTICELFAGVGGFRLGFERESKEWETVWFSQWEPSRKKQWAHDCYVGHFGDIDAKTGIDISLVDKTEIPDHNLLVGGFPCQDYSVARPLPGAKGLNGKKGVLWWQIRDTLEAKKAPFALFENVDRLLKSPASQRGRDFGVILACLASLGYSAEWRVINAAEYGAAQRRRRTFIFAYKNDTEYGKTKDLLEPDEIITDKGFFATSFPVEKTQDLKNSDVEKNNKDVPSKTLMGIKPKVIGIGLPYEDIPSVSENFKFTFENAGYMHKGMVYTKPVKPILEAPIPLKEIIEHGVDESYYIKEEALDKWKYLKGAKRVERTAKNGHKYNFSEGPVAFPDSLDKPARTMLTSETSLNRSSHVICDPETKRMRVLTPVEAERIQGFDSNWTGNCGMPEKFRYFCMGNALVVPMITRMAKTMDEIFNKEN